MILVTGATGFVGNAVVATVARKGIGVRGAVRRTPDSRVDGAEYALGVDLSSDCDWGIALAGVDAVVHAAARVHVMHDRTSDSLAECRCVNVAGTMNLARQAVAVGVRRFIFISSIKVNGEATEPGMPFTEADAPRPVGAYAISKAEAETDLLALAASTNMEVVVVRPPLVYGPGVRANFRSMTRWLAAGVPLPFGAVSDNRRSLVGLGNLVDLILTCLDHPAAANQLFLASDGEDLSTADLLRRTAAAMGVRTRLFPVPPPLLTAAASLVRRRDIMQRLCGSLQVDITKARRLLGWRPPFSVDEGLRRAVGRDDAQKPLP